MDASVAARELEHKIAELLDSKKLGPWIGDVTDGDSISAIANGRLVRVRILGIDCPELNQPFGDEAKQFTTDFCMNKTVKLVRDVVDRDGRLLADVTVGGQSLLEALLSAGLAWHYKEYRDDPDLSELEDEAQAAKRGLWADEDAVPPWDWRKWQALTERRRTAVNLDLESIDKAGAQN